MWNAAGLDDLDVTAEYCGDDLTQIQSSPGMDESVTMDMDYYTVTTGCW